MSIRQLIAEPTKVLEETVVDGSSTYVLRGSPDANILNESLLAREDQMKLLISHWKRVPEVGVEFNEDTVKQVLLVTRTLQPPDGEDPFDQLEIASLASKQSALFMKLVAAAMQVVGLAIDDQPNREIANEVMAGNSEPPAVTS